MKEISNKKNIKFYEEVTNLYVGLICGEYVVTDYDFRSSYNCDCSLWRVVKNVKRIQLSMFTFTKESLITDCYYLIDGDYVHESDLIAHFKGE